MIHHECTNCGEPLVSERSSFGLLVRCPACKTHLRAVPPGVDGDDYAAVLAERRWSRTRSQYRWSVALLVVLGLGATVFLIWRFAYLPAHEMNMARRVWAAEAEAKARQHLAVHGDADGAWSAAKGYVTQRLISPGSVRFPWPESLDQVAVETSTGRWRVVGWVDSQNRFGAVIRSNFTCQLQYDTGKWRLISLEMAER